MAGHVLGWLPRTKLSPARRRVSPQSVVVAYGNTEGARERENLGEQRRDGRGESGERGERGERGGGGQRDAREKEEKARRRGRRREAISVCADDAAHTVLQLSESLPPTHHTL